MEEFLKGPWWLLAGIGVTFIFSLLCQLLLSIYVLRMVKESGKLEDEKPELLGYWIEEYIKRENTVMDMSAFIEKEFQQFSIGKFTIIEIKHLSGQALLLMIFLAGLGACKGIMDGKTLGEILPFYIICLFGIYIHFSISAFINFEENKKIICMNMVDFLNNRRQYSYLKKDRIEENKKVMIKESLEEEQDLELKEIIREILA